MFARVLCSLFLLAFVIEVGAQSVAVPEPLRGWESWVLRGEEYRQCPFFGSLAPTDANAYACALAGPADIRINAGRANISVDYQVYGPGYVPLIIAERAMPEALSLDGQPGVVESGARIWLEPGVRQLRYSLDLATKPESLHVSPTLRLVQLSVDGRSVFPLSREGSVLWLQRAETTTESDALDFSVHRLWSDQLPQTLETRIKLHVAGKAREIRLGPVWPEGYELTGLDGSLPIVVEPGRMLRVQATAGNFDLTLHARALAPSQQLSFAFPQEQWPDQEIWSFAANHPLRVVDVSGAAPIDPAQGDVPMNWRALPAFAMSSKDELTLTERSRGLGDDANRLSLQRQLWLDFDGSGYTVQDQLSGRMRQGFRLDLAAPYELLSASERSQPLLVTTDAQGGRGIEVRYPAVNVEASARLPFATSMPAQGWSERLDSMNATLHLPPGYRLLHAGGVDRAPQAWIERWNIYSVFMAAFAVVLAWRLGGAWLATATALLAVLGVHEVGMPYYSLIALLLTMLGWQSLNAGRLRRMLGVAAVLAALVFVSNALPFAMTQARLALHPQLSAGTEDDSWLGANLLSMNMAAPEVAEVMSDDYGAVGGNRAAPIPSPAPMSPPPPPPSQDKEKYQTLQNQASRVKRVENLERYAKDAIVQAGNARPTWRWMQIDLGFDGPVDRQQMLTLWLTPPWLTAVWRLLLVAALAFITLLLTQRVRRRALPASVAAMTLLLLLGGPVTASELPDPDLLAELKARLTEAPRCAPVCVGLTVAQISIRGDQLTLTVEVHAAARVLLPLPLDDSALSEVNIQMDGKKAPTTGSNNDHSPWVAVERGVHQLSLSAQIRADRIALDFPMLPLRLELDLPGWTAAGIRDGRLLTERLELVREAPSVAAAAGAPTRVPIKPFVRVERRIDLDLDWTVTTTVWRVAPATGGFSVSVPLIAGEQPLDPALQVDEGKAQITLQPGASYTQFESRLTRSEILSLTAPDLGQRSEIWRISVGPSLSLSSSGVPISEPPEGIKDDQPWTHVYNPLPGETLTMRIARPAAVPGSTLVADRVDLSSDIGARSSTHSLQLSLRATQGGSHALKLPSSAELLNLSIDGRSINLKAEADTLTVPIKPGTQQLLLNWRDDQGVSTWVSTPTLDLGMDAANISLHLNLPSDRWILRLSGPPVGPAVLYWSSLLVLLVVGWGLGQSGRALLPTHSWILLVLGFSTLSYGPLLLIAVTFIALDARQRYLPGTLGKWRFDLLQVLLLGLTVSAFGVLVLTIPAGLLGSPDMHIAGGSGYGSQLAWLADRSTGVLPDASAISLPIWCYKSLMLAFALWLASALIRWIKLAWQALVAGTGWMQLRAHK